MSEIIKLIVNAEGNAKASIGTLEAAIKRLNATPIAIKIDSSAVDKLSSKMLTVANNQARAAIAAEKTKTAQATVKIETQKTAQEQVKLSQQVEKTGQAIEKTAQAVQRTQQASAQAETVEQRRRLLAEQMSASYEKMAIAAERSGGAASSIPINTPMQNQIETLARYQTLSAGSSANFLTAEQAARRFEVQGVSAFEKTLDAGKQTNNVVEKTGDSIGKLVGKVALWSAATTLIYGPIRAFREALTELQAVDDELVEVRKVTNASAAELEVLSDKAFKVGSTYGVAASDYMKSVAEMSRAGYDELSASLAELSVKTQLVGDMDAKTANQFLLSVDAAYKYHGSVAELSKVLDGANEIDNNYATSIEKIAEGLGKVAPIASQAHVGVNELSAAIGTITAVTQRSGTEGSTALRALFLNI
ncbi:MAG: phage tail tape measure protein, partial [Oscillospiraceae bacterium]